MRLKDWRISPQQCWGGWNIDILDDQTGCFPKVLRVHYPAGSASPAATRRYGAPVGGVQFLATCGLAPAFERHLRYSVRFAIGFQFARGGKLPGLCGGRVFSGGHVPDGINGFSTRYMWREQGDGELYLYSPRSRRFGDSLAAGAWRFIPGRWYRLDQRIVLNAPGIADGRVQVWIDGRRVLDVSDILFRTVSALRIDAILFSTFFGGGDLSWASPECASVDFAGFSLWARPPSFD